ncbi:hypothetical protein QNH10_01100 [Sporosarcina thermotolerans]|uniref:hypothetical protein n=1 Tax=Sporosarcina thermotolerans TaxID=633404 RepID=UPI0024BC16D9|nr:hypothetical protein [Sporosarcina thermotolerans]WHT48469.1 hypothetical protein QNH10_01100 [Sporosarcina thermotolerans]
MAYASQRIEVFDTKTPVLFPSSVPSYIRKLPAISPLLDDAAFNHLLSLLANGHRQFIPSPFVIRILFDIATLGRV